MNTNISKYAEPVVLNECETKQRCDCGGQTIIRMGTRENNTRVIIWHCELCTQDYYSLERVAANYR